MPCYRTYGRVFIIDRKKKRVIMIADSLIEASVFVEQLFDPDHERFWVIPVDKFITNT